MKRIIPNIWLNDTAEEAAAFYTSAFPHAKIIRVDHYTDAGKEQHGHQAGDVMTIELDIEGQRFIALNGGPDFTPTPAISFFIHCRTIDELDALWSNLAHNATVLMPLDTYPFSERYGWLQDQFGVSWQLILSSEDTPQKIIPSFLFTKDNSGKAEEAMNFYTSVFPDSSVGAISRYPAGQEPEKEGTVAYGEFTILGQQCAAMDSAQQHDFTFSPGVSLMVECADQAEVDGYWSKLSANPDAEICGWLQDKYGVSWQIVPTAMNEMLQNGTPAQIESVTTAFMQMKKLDIAELERVYNQSA